MHDPRNGLACLLLGLLCGDSGEFVQARALLGVALQLLEPNFPTYYALGRLRAAEGNWPEALAEFKKALALREQRAEPQFAVACAYYALKRFKLAARFMRKALEADEDLGEAWYRLGLLAWRAGERQEARGLFQTAAKSDAKNPLYREAARQRWNAGEAPAEPPFFGLSARGKKLISSGDKSLAVFLRDEIERLCWSYPPRDIESWRDLQPAKLDD